MHKSSLEKMEKFILDYLKDQDELKVIDVGSRDTNGSYRPFFSKRGWEYKGLDIVGGKNVDIVSDDPYNWSDLEDDSVDVVISGSTFEHIEFPWKTMEEIKRILKPGGMCFILTTSFGEYHPVPVDCYRFFADGLRALAKHSDLEVVHCLTDNVGIQWRDSVLMARKEAVKPRTIRKPKPPKEDQE